MNSLLEQSPRYARYQGQLYLVESEAGDLITLRHPDYIGGDWVAVYLTAGAPIIHSARVTLHRRDCDFLKTEAVQPLPPIPITSGLQVGSRVRWGTSLAEWAVLSITDEQAQIRQVAGWAEALVWDAPISELVSLSDRASADVARAA